MSASHDRVHPVDEVLPAGAMFAVGLQHVLVMYAGAIAVPLIIGGALKLPKEQVAFLINADLFACGIATLIQCLGVWKFGIRLPVVMGVTFAAVGPMAAMATSGVGITGIFGVVTTAGMVNFAGVAESDWFAIVYPFRFGTPTFDVSAVVSLCIVMIVVMVESTGMFLALGEICDKKIGSAELGRGLATDGLGPIIGGVLNP